MLWDLCLVTHVYNNMPLYMTIIILHLVMHSNACVKVKTGSSLINNIEFGPITGNV